MFVSESWAVVVGNSWKSYTSSSTNNRICKNVARFYELAAGWSDHASERRWVVSWIKGQSAYYEFICKFFRFILDWATFCGLSPFVRPVLMFQVFQVLIPLTLHLAYFTFILIKLNWYVYFVLQKYIIIIYFIKHLLNIIKFMNK